MLLALLLFCQTALAEPRTTVLYDSALRPDLGAFELYLESESETAGRPRLGRVDGALSAVPGDGNFTAWKFADVAAQDFTLVVRFHVPADAEDSNSGIFLLQGDPRALTENLPESERAAHAHALRLAAERKQQYGAGPFELDYFAYEVQIARGKAVAADPANKRSGTFYGVPQGQGVGSQEILSSYEILPGEEYELKLEARAGVLATYLRSVRWQPAFVPVARLRLDPADPVRGGVPRALLLQAYWNNGSSAKGIRFSHFSLTQ